MRNARQEEIVIYKGADADLLQFRLLQPDKTPVDMTGMDIEMEIRTSVNGDLILARRLGAGIVIDAGVVRAKITRAESEQITQSFGVYDLFITDAAGSRDVYFYGPVKIIENVTNG